MTLRNQISISVSEERWRQIVNAEH